MAIEVMAGPESGSAAVGRQSARRATVAVVMSNYNHARYLGESLGGIGAQTRPADEIIIIAHFTFAPDLASAPQLPAHHKKHKKQTWRCGIS